jgi:uncharacterized protein YaiE (UPF0345 family)
VIEAHPAKDPMGAWWYGTLVKEGKKGWFPSAYIEEMSRESASHSVRSVDCIQFLLHHLSRWWAKKELVKVTVADDVAVKAKAQFSYDGQSPDELPFLEGDILTIVDTSDSDWWKTEKAGVIFIVPASYFELLG